MGEPSLRTPPRNVVDTVLGFARTLRSAGVAASPDRVEAMLTAVGALDVLDATSVYWAGRLTLCASPDDLERTVTIRGGPHSVPLAMARSLGHTCYHVGQIVQVARIHAGENWQTLTIPRGGSQQYNQSN